MPEAMGVAHKEQVKVTPEFKEVRVAYIVYVIKYVLRLPYFTIL